MAEARKPKAKVFEITAEDGAARTGVLTTKSAKIETPFFMPVATKATAKYVDAKDFEDIKAQSIISNAFVLYLTPGADLINKLGGIHKFMNFKGNIFTDSGGFQMYSDSFLLGTKKDGVFFKNPFNGEKIFCTPEDNMELQLKIDSDVAMCLDSMPRFGHSKRRIIDSLQKTHEWAKRCKEYHDKHDKNGQLLFGIAQGGTYPDLRKLSAKKISEIGFDGLAFGGLALGEPVDKMFEAIKAGMEEMPKEKIKYLMGVGEPTQIVEAVGLGVDCFDSRYPTMTARHNQIMTSKGNITIDKKEYAEDEGPLDEECDCWVCKRFSRAYLYHLIKTREPNALRYLTIHNLRLMMRLMEDIRKAIKEGRFEEFKQKIKENFKKK